MRSRDMTTTSLIYKYLLFRHNMQKLKEITKHEWSILTEFLISWKSPRILTKIYPFVCETGTKQQYCKDASVSVNHVWKINFHVPFIYENVNIHFLCLRLSKHFLLCIYNVSPSSTLGDIWFKSQGNTITCQNQYIKNMMWITLRSYPCN